MVAEHLTLSRGKRVPVLLMHMPCGVFVCFIFLLFFFSFY